MKKKFFLLPFLIVFPFLFINFVYAQEDVDQQTDVEEYIMEEVEQHNEEGDCWMVFEDGVYDFSEYLPDHDKFMDIREWCGMDMTEDFKDKAGIGRDHREGTYELLAEYRIGELRGEVDLVDAEIILDNAEEEEITRGREYNILIPFVLTTVLYCGMYFLVKANKFFGINIHKYNAFWNTVLLLLLLIPGMIFGIFMMIRTQKPELWDIDFEFMYWHVELSLIMGFVAIYHFIQRIPQYFAQLKRTKKV
jgi:cytochrome b involved in lipid metabolism